MKWDVKKWNQACRNVEKKIGEIITGKFESEEEVPSSLMNRAFKGYVMMLNALTRNELKSGRHETWAMVADTPIPKEKSADALETSVADAVLWYVEKIPIFQEPQPAP